MRKKDVEKEIQGSSSCYTSYLNLSAFERVTDFSRENGMRRNIFPKRAHGGKARMN